MTAMLRFGNVLFEDCIPNTSLNGWNTQSAALLVCGPVWTSCCRQWLQTAAEHFLSLRTAEGSDVAIHVREVS
jgi:hypothetical protein